MRKLTNEQEQLRQLFFKVFKATYCVYGQDEAEKILNELLDLMPHCFYKH